MNYKSFSTIAEAEALLRQVVSDALNGEIAEAAVNKEASLASSVVYSYPVKVYQRRYSFSSPGNYMITPGDMSVTITSTATPSSFAGPRSTATTNKSLPYVVEYGVGYDFVEVGARPLVARTAAELVGSGELLKILRKALNGAGIAVAR